jgi:hypothetical protein
MSQRPEEPPTADEKQKDNCLFSRVRLRRLELFPPLEREELLQMVETLREGSKWNMNFGVLLACSVIIASLGLLQDSVAVVIGAMLVAPMMTPLIGMGLALVHETII